METPEIMQAVRDYVRSHFHVPDTDADFTDDVHLFNFGYVDSFGAMELTAFVMDHCAITISAADLIAYELNSIRQISTFAAKRKIGAL
jgi:D-alanine--poly(phosphoribitol) ligase subunit 2